MKLLFDTHILLWSLAESERLPLRMKNAIEEKSNDLWLSPITIIIKYVLKQIVNQTLRLTSPEFIRPALAPISKSESIISHDIKCLNIAVSSYVVQEDTREVVDITHLNAKISRIFARQNKLRTAIDEIVADLEGSRQ